MPAVSEQDFEAIKEISKLGLKSKIYTFARAINADIDKAHRMRLPRRDHRGSHRLSEAEVSVQVDLGRRAAQERRRHQLRQVARHARGVFPVRHDARARRRSDATCCTRIMQEAPPDSVGVVDTMGCILPEAMKFMVRMVKKLTKPAGGSAHAQRFRHGGGDRAGRRRSGRRVRPQLRERAGRADRQRGARGTDRRAARALRLRHAVQAGQAARAGRAGQPHQRVPDRGRTSRSWATATSRANRASASIWW